jgi:hypothetical protein
VVWTKPDDFEPDKDDPLKGVVGLRAGKFLGLFADGAARAFEATMDKEIAEAIFSRAGGETVQFPD